ncbi:uncharacterized protein LOC120781390 [Bactrocera tryoni]|uniref:uncharacterized protein LOC120781390 n=1 Tax=Bactrocera tryoni TaxID=59916 RepID=UPI001A96E893|nr:uncharacterized protein LOC120781390 [Bactrocera tryoni]
MDSINFKRFPAVASSRPAIQINNLNQWSKTCKTAKIDSKTTAVCDHCFISTCSKHYIRTCEKCYFTKYNVEADTDSDNNEDADNSPTTSTPNQNALNHSEEFHQFEQFEINTLFNFRVFQ